MRGVGRAASMLSSVTISAGVKNCLRFRLGLFPCRHGEEKYPPADHRNEGKELRQSICGLEPCLFGAAAGFHHLVKDLDFPAQGVPFKFLDGGGDIADRQIGHQLPVDRRTVLRRVDLKSMDVGEKLGRSASAYLWVAGFR